MTTTQIAEMALIFSALTVYFSGNSWYHGWKDRRAKLILKVKSGAWSRSTSLFFATTLIVFNPSSRANCIQEYRLKVRTLEGDYLEFPTEALSTDNGPINPLPLSIPSATGVEFQVGTVEADMNRLPLDMEIIFELQDIYGEWYSAVHTLRNRYAGRDPLSR